ncbi:MAG: hypothetical protein GY821_05765 [Gammaproteobacteria bacterium]|nr:hypothetical protein [Gammaproteobacteria bacterium]
MRGIWSAVLYDAVEEPANQAQHAFVSTITLLLQLQFLQLTAFLNQHYGSGQEQREICRPAACQFQSD